VLNINTVWRGWKPTEEAKPEPTGNGELRRNSGEKLGKAAEKHPGAGCEAVIVGERPLCEKAVDDRSGRELKFAEGLAEGSRSPPFSFCFFERFI